MTTLEARAADLHQRHFLREFTYSQSTFCPKPNEELELADSLIVIGVKCIIYQMKERAKVGELLPTKEARWFSQKVIGIGVNQINDTKKYLNDNKEIELYNDIGHKKILKTDEIEISHNVIVYSPSKSLPYGCRWKKFHMSKRVGFVHLFPEDVYVLCANLLITPVEILNYLDFRQKIVEKWPAETSALSEECLLGQYINDSIDACPSPRFISILEKLENKTEEWDMSGILSTFHDRMMSEYRDTDYYPILQELAMLSRSELIQFRQRFMLAIEKSQKDEFTIPYRLSVPRTDCSFIVIPVTRELFKDQARALENFTLLHKYEMKTQKGIGVTIADDANGYFTALWMYINSPWEREEVFEDIIKNRNPLRSVESHLVPRYTVSR